MQRTHVVVGAMVLVAVTAVAPAGAQDAPTITSQVVTSFDGTPIVSTLFLPAGASDEQPVPLVMRTHGWGGSGEKEVGGTLERLLDEGYAVLTWDQRGFGCSGGEVQVDSPDFEARDASTLIDWAVANAPIATAADGDPLVAFSGGSYAGGIQTVTSSIDPRVDAIAPEVSWSDLRYSLEAGGVVNQGWALILYGAGTSSATAGGLTGGVPPNPDTAGQCSTGTASLGGLAPDLHEALLDFVPDSVFSDDTRDYFARRSLAGYGQASPVAIPTLVLNGSVDTLFDLSDGWGIVEHVRGQGAPASFVAFCGGHVACPGSYATVDDRAHLDDRIVAWFDHHLRGNRSVDPGPEVEYRTNEGEWRSADDFPRGAQADHTVAGSAAGPLVVVPVAGVPDVEQAVTALLSYSGGIPALPVTSSSPSVDGDPRAVVSEVAAAPDGGLELLGIPTVTLTATSDVLPDAHLMVKLVHREAGEVVNLQEGSIRLVFDGGTATAEVPMPGLAYSLPAGHHLDLEVATHSLMHATGRLPGTLDVEATVTVPVRTAAAAAHDPDTDPAPEADDAPAPAPDPTPEGGSAPAEASPLPSTGGGFALAGMLAVAAYARRRR